MAISTEPFLPSRFVQTISLAIWLIVCSVLLWLALPGTVIAFWKVRPLAGVLLFPYLAWVTFASVLNCTLWRLNR